MKNVLKNRRGFTLIELLAVIVILAILVMVAIPAVTKYLNTARAGTYVDNAKSAIDAVRTDVIANGVEKTTFTVTDINALLEKKLINSPFGSRYCNESKVEVSFASDGTTTYTVSLYDKAGHGWKDQIKENELTNSDVAISGMKDLECTEVSKDGLTTATGGDGYCLSNTGCADTSSGTRDACVKKNYTWIDGKSKPKDIKECSQSKNNDNQNNDQNNG